MPTRPETLTFLGLDQPIPAEVNGRTNGVRNKSEWDAAYHPCPEAFPDEDVPTGDVIEFEDWSETSVYPGTKRQIQVYKPSGVLLDDTAVIVFNDGPAYLSRNGPVRAAQVLAALSRVFLQVDARFAQLKGEGGRLELDDLLERCHRLIATTPRCAQSWPATTASR